jgi:hypothetical protein
MRIPRAALLFVIAMALVLAVALFLRTRAQAADVHVGVSIGVPAPPPIVLEAPPRVVAVPAVPGVLYAPDVSFNFFVYGGRYWTWHDGGWFAAPSYGGPWAYVPAAGVPRPVVVVPARYYKVPPRWARKHHRHGKHGHRRGRGHGHDD